MMLGRHTLSRFLARHRRATAGLCAALSVLCLGLALRPPSLPTVRVPAASRDLPTGHRLGPDDLRTVDVPAALAPVGASAGSEALVGRVLAAPVTAGEPVVEARLVGPDAVAWTGPPGTTAVPVRFADAGAVGLIDAGQRVDVLAASPADPGALPRAQVVAAGVMVLGVVRGVAGDEAALGPLTAPSGPGGEGSDLVLLAATPDEVLALAAAEAGSRLTFSMAGPDRLG
jgi:pilus assembly protein CpaB